jgi:hypothetical protein
LSHSWKNPLTSQFRAVNTKSVLLNIFSKSQPPPIHLHPAPPRKTIA